VIEPRRSGDRGRPSRTPDTRGIARVAVLAASAAVGAAVAGAAFAAPLGLVSGLVGSGSSAIPRCDQNGSTYSFATSGGDVVSVTVGDIADPGCEGGELHVTLTDAAGNAIASGGPAVVPTNGDVTRNEVTLPTTAQPAAGDVARAHASVVGP